jgi:hypothetical protein
MPRDIREWQAQLAMALNMPLWMLLARPLGGVTATIGIFGTLAVCLPVYTAWRRRRVPTPRRSS